MRKAVRTNVKDQKVIAEERRKRRIEEEERAKAKARSRSKKLIEEARAKEAINSTSNENHNYTAGHRIDPRAKSEYARDHGFDASEEKKEGSLDSDGEERVTMAPQPYPVNIGSDEEESSPLELEPWWQKRFEETDHKWEL